MSTTGDDSSPGSLDQPWLTVQHALDTLAPGETALVREGTYDENLRMTRDGTDAKPITIANYPVERAVLRPEGGLENSFPIEIDSASYFRLHGFVIEGATRPVQRRRLPLRAARTTSRSRGTRSADSSDQGIYSE